MFRLTVLGGLSLHGSAGELQVQRKSLLLLATLALARDGGMSRERIAGLFWPESDEERAANSLRQRLFVLRRELGRDDLFTGTGELRLAPGVFTTDCGDFDAADAAGDVETMALLYRGPLLEGVFVRESAELERWIDQSRERYRSRAHAAFARAAREASASGDHAAAGRWWRRVADLDPTNADAATGLIESLVQQGDAAAAMRHFRVYEALVRQEFGVAVDPRLAARIAQLPSRLAGRPPQEVAAREAAPREPAMREPAATASADAVPVRPDEAPVASAPPTWRPAFRRIAAAAVTFVIAGAALWLSPWARRATASNERIVVVPFENQTGDSSLASVSTIAADWVVQGLLRVGTPDVVDARSVLAQASDSTAARSPLALARAMDARMAVSGSYFRRADSLFVQAHIVDVASGRTMQVVEPVGATRGNLLAAIDRVRQKVMGAVSAIREDYLDTTALGQAQPPTFEAYQEYVAGLQFLSNNQPGKARLRFLAALEKDSTFIGAAMMAAAHSGDSARRRLRAYALANERLLSPIQRATLQHGIRLDAMDNEGAYLAARRAVELAPRSNDALVSLGYSALLTRRYAESIAVFERVDLTQGWMRNWRFYYAHAGSAYHLAGQLEKQLALEEHGLRRFPRDGEMCLVIVEALAALGRAAELEERLQRCPVESGQVGKSYGQELLLLAARELRAHGHEAFADRYFARITAAAESEVAAGARDSVGLALAYNEARRYDDAHRILRSRVDTTPTRRAIVVNTVAAVAAHHAGDAPTARRHRDWLRSQDADTSHVVVLHRARVAAHLGDHDEAIALIVRARDRFGRSLIYLHNDWGFLPLQRSREYHRVTGPR